MQNTFWYHPGWSLVTTWCLKIDGVIHFMNLSQIVNVIDHVYPLDTGLSHIFCKLFPYNHYKYGWM